MLSLPFLGCHRWQKLLFDTYVVYNANHLIISIPWFSDDIIYLINILFNVHFPIPRIPYMTEAIVWFSCCIQCKPSHYKHPMDNKSYYLINVLSNVHFPTHSKGPVDDISFCLILELYAMQTIVLSASHGLQKLLYIW